MFTVSGLIVYGLSLTSKFVAHGFEGSFSLCDGPPATVHGAQHDAFRLWGLGFK